MREYKEIHFSEGTPLKIKQKLYEAYKYKKRVKITYEDGFEDFSGYHDKTGLIHYCFIGCSTGTKPILLEIYSRRSTGGPALLTSKIKAIEVM